MHRDRIGSSAERAAMRRVHVDAERVERLQGQLEQARRDLAEGRALAAEVCGAPTADAQPGARS